MVLLAGDVAIGRLPLMLEVLVLYNQQHLWYIESSTININ